MTQSVSTTYVPGVCNINRAEIAMRRKAGYYGDGLFVVASIALVFLTGNRWLRLIVFVAAFVGAIGYLQARSHFCVSYAASGQQNVVDGSTGATKITDNAAHAADKKRALRMNLQAAGIAVVATALILLIPTR